MLLFCYLLFLLVCPLKTLGHERFQIAFQCAHLERDQVHEDEVPLVCAVLEGGRRWHKPNILEKGASRLIIVYFSKH